MAGKGEMEVDGDALAYDALSEHPRIADLAAITRTVLKAATETRRPESAAAGLTELAAARALRGDDARTSFGNALEVLGRGPTTPEERALAHALAAHALAAYPPTDSDAERTEAADLVWLAAHTPFDALGLVGRALGDRAPALTAAVTSVVFGGLAQALGPVPRPVRAPSETPETLCGQIAAIPRGPFATTFLGLTGCLLVVHGVRLFARWALGYKAPAEVVVSENGGVRVRWRVELLGRTLRDRDVFVPREGLARATREVRFAGAALYAGLTALAIGSYVGVSALVDGVRAASPPLLAAGLAIVALGLGVDFALSCALPGARGRCRVVFVPRRGQKLCVGEIDKARADALLGHLTRA